MSYGHRSTQVSRIQFKLKCSFKILFRSHVYFTLPSNRAPLTDEKSHWSFPACVTSDSAKSASGSVQFVEEKFALALKAVLFSVR